MTQQNEHQDVELGRLAAEIEAAGQEARRYRAKDWWRPYGKQSQFFATGLRFRERGLFAGTQLGKTECAAYEVACHLTGRIRAGLAGPQVHAADQGVGGRREPEDDARHHAEEAVRRALATSRRSAPGMIPKHLFVGDPTLARGEGERATTPSRCGTNPAALLRCAFAPIRPAAWPCRVRP